MMHTFTTALVGAVAASSAFAQDTVLFGESDFDPSGWTTMASFFSGAPEVGQTQSASTARFTGNNPANDFLLQQFTMNIPQGFNSVHAPVFMDAWTYDPSVDGPITSIAFNMTTLHVSDLSPAYGTPRAYLMQDGRLYASSQPGGNFFGFNFFDPDEVRGFAGATEAQFIEYVPNVGLFSNNHPDFSGSEIQFGFGTTLTSTSLSGAGELTRAIGIDNVNYRIETIPAPGGAALVGLGLLVTARRRR